MNPTFTSTPPTKPGWFLKRTVINGKESDSLMWVTQYDIGGRRLNTPPCLWCRLVPAEEVEKAYQEGFEDGAMCFCDGASWDKYVDSYFTKSRAKQVMEGEV